MTRTAAAAAATTAFVAAGPAAAAAAGRLGGGEALGVSLGRIVLALIICLVIAVFAILLLRQKSGRTDLRALFARFEMKPRLIDVVETRRLSPHADICVVRHGGREYLLLLLAGAARILSEEPVGAAASEAEANS